MTNRFSRSIARAQPTPKVCKSKHITPLAPPPFDPTIAQLQLNIYDDTSGTPWSINGVYTMTSNISGDIWEGIAHPGTQLETILSGGPILPSENYVLQMDVTQPVYINQRYTARMSGFIPLQPYDSQQVIVFTTANEITVGTARLIV